MNASRFGRFQKKMMVVASSSSSSVTLGSVQRTRAPLRCCPGSSFLRQMGCKLKGRWNKALGWQRRSPHPQYSYDHHSYCLNFDDGAFNEEKYY